MYIYICICILYVYIICIPYSHQGRGSSSSYFKCGPAGVADGLFRPEPRHFRPRPPNSRRRLLASGQDTRIVKNTATPITNIFFDKFVGLLFLHMFRCFCKFG